MLPSIRNRRQRQSKLYRPNIDERQDNAYDEIPLEDVLYADDPLHNETLEDLEHGIDENESSANLQDNEKLRLESLKLAVNISKNGKRNDIITIASELYNFIKGTSVK